MYPFASLPENLAAFCDALRRQHGFRIGPGEVHDAARALGRRGSRQRARGSPRASAHPRRHAATTSRPSTRRSRSSSFPAPPVFHRIRWPPRGGSRGPAPTAAKPTPRARAPDAPIRRRRGRRARAWRRTADTARVGRRWARRGRDRRAFELQPARRRHVRRARVAARRAGVARCRAIVRAPAAPRPVAPLAAGDPGTTLRPSPHVARRPSDRRRGAIAALAAPPAAGAANRAAGRRQPLDERLRTDRAADGGRAWRARRCGSRCSRSRQSSSA